MIYSICIYGFIEDKHKYILNYDLLEEFNCVMCNSKQPKVINIYFELHTTVTEKLIFLYKINYKK
jgi:hypothetical protein